MNNTQPHILHKVTITINANNAMDVHVSIRDNSDPINYKFKKIYLNSYLERAPDGKKSFSFFFFGLKCFNAI